MDERAVKLGVLSFANSPSQTLVRKLYVAKPMPSRMKPAAGNCETV